MLSSRYSYCSGPECRNSGQATANLSDHAASARAEQLQLSEPTHRAPRGRFPLKAFATLGLLATSLLLTAEEGQASVVERVVAVVGDDAVLLSDLRTRARPYLVRINQQVPSGAQRTAAISQLYGTVLQRLVDERLQERAALKARVVVTAQEIGDALSRVAKQNNISVEQLMAEATRSGMTEDQYRQEIRRQLLEAKLLNIRVQGRIRVTGEDVRAAYRALVIDERKQLAFQAAWILLKVPGPERLEASRADADALALAARAGADFAALARSQSVDAATRTRGGLMETMKPGQLPPQVDKVLLTLDPGQISAPVRVGNHFAVVKLLSRAASSLPSLAKVEQQVQERVYAEKMAKARERWIENLKRQTHVDVRL